MDNKEIARHFQLLGKLTELHGENPFKARSYTNAYLTLRKWPDELSSMDLEAITKIPGVGKAISEKLIELNNTGRISALDKLLEITPPGVVEMLGIKGFGPKKIRTIWQDLGVETIGELLYAVNENRLIDLKGFGAKTQATLRKQLEYYLDSAGKLHFAQAEWMASEIIARVREKFPDEAFEATGALRRKSNVIEKLAFIGTVNEDALYQLLSDIDGFQASDEKWTFKSVEFEYTMADADNFNFKWARHSSAPEFWTALNIPPGSYASEKEVFTRNGWPWIIPECRENENTSRIKSLPDAEDIMTYDDIRGCIHNHTTYSDGLNSIEEMVNACAEKSYEYFVLTDHSRSAFYANGLSIERLYQQLDEIRIIDQSREDVRIFSGIESDILNNGDLDYPDDVLAELDVVVASIHSNLKMDMEKATQRLITAIENPYTNILGHPTGRLLLSREGYPVDHQKIIDACASNNVCIELNANPYRLDIDWRWIGKCMDKGVLVSVNPDAHSITGIQDMFFGICSARKGGLSKSGCLNAMALDEFEEWLAGQHEKR